MIVPLMKQLILVKTLHISATFLKLKKQTCLATIDLLLREPGNIYSKACTLPQKKTSYKNNISNRLSETVYLSCGAESVAPAYELSHEASAELMRTKYCIRYELGMCPKHHGSKETGPLYLLNNGQRFVLRFDCRNCEMTLSEA